MKLLQRILQRVVLRPRSKTEAGRPSKHFWCKKSLLSSSFQRNIMFPAKEAPASSHMLVSWAELFQKKVSRLIPPRSALIRGQGNRKANEQAASEQAGKASRRRAGRQQAAQADSSRQGKQKARQAGAQTSKQKQTSRQAGKAGRQACQAALTGRKSKAGRNVNPPFLLEGRV